MVSKAAPRRRAFATAGLIGVQGIRACVPTHRLIGSGGQQTKISDSCLSNIPGASSAAWAASPPLLPSNSTTGDA